MKRLLLILLAMALLGSISATCFALGQRAARERRISLTLTCIDKNGKPAIEVRSSDGRKFVSDNLTLTGGDQAVAITVHDKEIEVVIGGQVIRASELRLITNCDLRSIEGKRKK